VGSLLILTAAPALSQKKNNAKSTVPQATPQEYAQLSQLKQIGGTLMVIDSGSNYLTLRVTIPQLQRNPNYRPPRINTNNNHYHHYYNNNRSGYNMQHQMASMMHRYQQIMMNRNPIQREQEMMQLSMQMQQMEMRAMMQMQMQAQRVQVQEAQQMARIMQQVAQANSNPNNQPFKIVTTQKDFDLELQDNATVRKMYLGTEYDDTGNVKKYTKAELAELRGKDSAKPGYSAKLEDLQPGQEVALYLTPPKKASAKADVGAAAPANPKRPSVRMIVMTRELTADSASLASKKR
jgi:hypothetical protein